MVLEAVCAPLFCQHKVYLLGLPEIYTFSLSKRAKAQGMNIVILPLCFVCVWRKIEREREGYNDVMDCRLENHGGINDASKLLLLMSLQIKNESGNQI